MILGWRLLWLRLLLRCLLLLHFLLLLFMPLLQLLSLLLMLLFCLLLARLVHLLLGETLVIAVLLLLEFLPLLVLLLLKLFLLLLIFLVRLRISGMRSSGTIHGCKVFGMIGGGRGVARTLGSCRSRFPIGSAIATTRLIRLVIRRWMIRSSILSSRYGFTAAEGSRSSRSRNRWFAVIC